MADESPDLNTGEVAGALGLSKSTVLDYTKKGLLFATRTFGGHRRYPPDTVEELRRVLKMPAGAERDEAFEELRRRNQERGRQ